LKNGRFGVSLVLAGQISGKNIKSSAFRPFFSLQILLNPFYRATFFLLKAPFMVTIDAFQKMGVSGV
jgi:hypothetical protein